MAKPQVNIGKQLLVFALIAAIFNIYALQLWCSITMGADHHRDVNKEKHYQVAALNDHHSSVGSTANKHCHNSASNNQEKKSTCPHKGSSKSGNNCCKDQTNMFFTSLSGSGLWKFNFTPDNLHFTIPNNFWFADTSIGYNRTLPVKLFPQEGLKPKIPDKRIFFCSLII